MLLTWQIARLLWKTDVSNVNVQQHDMSLYLYQRQFDPQQIITKEFNKL